MSEPALRARGLTKRYAGVVAVDALDLEVQPGEIVGLLGPNGAGKTTAMLLALGLLDRDGGDVRLFGEDPERLSVRRRLGFAPDAPAFPRALTGYQALELHGELAGLPRARARIRAREVAAELGLAEAAARPTAQYSKGQAQRLGLAAALLGEPALLLLDEPTAGLDPAGVVGLRALLTGLRARGVAVLLNSHLLSEVERVCDKVLFIKGGRVLRTHDVRAGGRRAELRLANLAAVGPRLLARFPEGTVEHDCFRVAVADESVVPALVRAAVEAGGEVLEARLAGAELEELYLAIVQGEA